MAELTDIKDRPEWVYLELDRKLFIEEILNIEFDGNMSECARAMGMNPVCLCALIKKTDTRAGKINLTRILRYCLKTGREPLRYITKIMR